LVPSIVLTMGDRFYWPRKVQLGRHSEEAIEAQLKEERDPVHV